jgi:hypothetical protein
MKSKSSTMKSKLAIIALLPVAALVSCQKDQALSHSSNGSSIVFGLRASNSATTLNRIATTSAQSRTDGTTVQWTSAQASVTMIKLEAKSNSGEVEFKSNVKRTIDLFNDTSTLGSISLPTGNFNQVEFKVQLNPDGSKPALELKGQFTNGSTTTNITFRADESIEIKGEKSAINLTDFSIHNAITSLDLSQITQHISASDLSNAVITNGEILINAQVNANLYHIIVKNLRNLEKEEDFD